MVNYNGVVIITVFAVMAAGCFWLGWLAGKSPNQSAVRTAVSFVAAWIIGTLFIGIPAWLLGYILGRRRRDPALALIGAKPPGKSNVEPVPWGWGQPVATPISAAHLAQPNLAEAAFCPKDGTPRAAGTRYCSACGLDFDGPPPPPAR